MGADPTHEFGTEDTEIKLSLIQDYLQAYTSALRRKWPRLWYIDAFAGTGSRTVRIPARPGTLLGDEPTPERVEQRRGSAQIAIGINPPFDRLVFMERNPRYCVALEELKAQHSDRDITVVQGDANRLIQDQIAWSGWRSTRAVLFLDPYGMEVEWATLKAIANTRAIDVWYLFPLAGLYRQAARDIADVDESKSKALTRMLGNEDWKQELYSPVSTGQHDLLSGLETTEVLQRNADVAGLERYVKRRLEDIFPLVLDPFPLPVARRPQMFSLFFAVSNDDPRAIGLARKFGNHILSRGISS